MTKAINCFKLVSGEDIVSEFEPRNDGRVTLVNPVRILMLPPKISGGTPGITMAPWPMYNGDQKNFRMVVELLHVVYAYVPHQDIVTQYNSLFGSGIMVPSTKQIISG